MTTSTPTAPPAAPLTLRLLFLCLFFSLTSIALTAQAAASDASSQLSDEQLEQLINTLEDPQAREAYLENLHTLIETESALPEEERAPLISEFFHIDETSTKLMDRYTQSLNALGISDNLIGNIAITLLTAVLLMIGARINKRLARHFDKRLVSVRQRFHLDKNRFSGYFKIQILAGYLLAICLFVYTLFSLFSLVPDEVSQSVGGLQVIEFSITLLIICFLATTFWELPNAFFEYTSHRSHHLTEARVQTLLPVVRNILTTTLAIMLFLIVLSELGIDIVPILAGAGIAGIAIGFGAQALVKDFLTGFIVIFEDLLQVGDVVKVGDREGLVEKITLRKIQLRNLDGTVHTVPFSEVDVVDNYTKEYSYYLMDIGVAYREDVNEVIDCLTEIDEEMREDSHFKNLILAPLEVLGVDKFADSAVIVRVRTKTKAHEKWSVGREFNRRIKILFDQRNIEIPFPHQTIYFGEDKSGEAPSARVSISKNNEQATPKDEQKKTDKEPAPAT